MVMVVMMIMLVMMNDDYCAAAGDVIHIRDGKGSDDHWRRLVKNIGGKLKYCWWKCGKN